jgi:hypothetical protein
MRKNLVLKLYVSGVTPTVKNTIENLKTVCREISDEYKYSIDIIDIMKTLAWQIKTISWSHRL